MSAGRNLSNQLGIRDSKGGDGRFFSTTKKGETQELRAELQAAKAAKKIDAVKKVIANMTVGKDVSMLFPDVLNCIQTSNLELKKLVYLYLVNYAKSNPDMALLAVNTFVKDAADPNPLVRALAIRTMGCIRVERITEYLCEPLEKGLKDEDPYVRKTAAVCVAKLHDIAPDLVADRGFLDMLRDLVSDPNPTVVANAVAALSEVVDDGGDALGMSAARLNKLLAALNECTEWGQVSILDALAKYAPAEAKDAERVIERVTPRLQHANAAVVLSAVKVILQYMHETLDPETELCAGYRKKLAPPLVTLVNTAEPEMCYVALRNINLIVQRDKRILEAEIRVFFCKYNDPIYVKLEKLEIMIRLVSERNVDQVLLEFKEYAQEVDIDFVRRAIKAIGRCAIKLERAAQRCVNVLLELIKTRVNYVVQAAVVVVKDIFRKYPNKYESIITALCENMDNLDEPEAKQAMIWIIGEYAEAIENADELLAGFLENFEHEEHLVKLQILTATVKLFLKLPGTAAAEEMVQKVLSLATEATDDPDLRDRGFVYWRLLSANPECAKAVVLGKKPPIEDDTDKLAPETLNDLLAQLATLSSVYHKPPEAFIVESKAGPGEAADEGFDDFDDGPGDDDGLGDALGGDDAFATPAPAPAPPPAGGGDLLDLLDMGGLGETPPLAAPAAPPAADLVADALGDIFGGGPAPTPPASAPDPFGLGGGLAQPTALLPPAPPFVRPPAPILAPSPQSSGVGVRAAFNAGADGCVNLDVSCANGGAAPLRLLQVQLNKSAFGLAPAGAAKLEFAPPLAPGASSPTLTLVLKAGDARMLAPAPAMAASGLSVQIAMKHGDTGAVFYLAVPCPFDALWARDASVDRSEFITKWQAIDDAHELYGNVANLPTGASVDAASQKLGARRCHFVARRDVPGGTNSEVAYFAIRTVGLPHEFLVELTFQAGVAACKVCVKTTATPFAALAKAAVEEILGAP